MKTCILTFIAISTVNSLYGQTTNSNILLADLTINPYLPDADVVITTHDETNYNSDSLLDENNRVAQRSRIDWPFNVSYTIRNVDQTNNPLADNITFYQVDVFTEAMAYPSDYSLVNGMTRVGSSISNQRISATLNVAYSNSPLAGSGITFGELYFSARSIRLEDTDPPNSVAAPKTLMESQPLDKETLQNLPKVRGEFDLQGGELVNNVTVFTVSNTPALLIKFKDIYPNSYVFMQAYEGALQSGAALRGKMVPGTFYKNSDLQFPTAPAERNLQATTWATFMTPGDWNLELVSLTPISSTAAFTTNGFSTLTGNNSGGGSAFVALNEINDYSVPAGRYLLEIGRNGPAGDPSGVKLTPDGNILIRAGVTTNQ